MLIIICVSNAVITAHLPTPAFQNRSGIWVTSPCQRHDRLFARGVSKQCNTILLGKLRRRMTLERLRRRSVPLPISQCSRSGTLGICSRWRTFSLADRWFTPSNKTPGVIFSCNWSLRYMEMPAGRPREAAIKVTGGLQSVLSSLARLRSSLFHK